MYLFSPELCVCKIDQQVTISGVETLLDQGSGSTNEDILLQSGNLYGVFDGATSLKKRGDEFGKTGGLLAAETAAHAFSCNGATLRRLGERANRDIRELMETRGIDLDFRHHIWSTSGTVVRIDGEELEWFQIGDTQALLLYEDGSYHKLGAHVDHDRETLSFWKELGPRVSGTIQESLSDQIIKVREGMNIQYGVLNGEPQACNFFQHGRVSLTGVTDIILYTDGLVMPRSHPDLPDDLETFVSLYRSGGLKLIHNRVREIQKTDPRCLSYPRFKTHDDIAALGLRIHEK
jgi:Protein phosphatase 2C